MQTKIHTYKHTRTKNAESRKQYMHASNSELIFSSHKQNIINHTGNTAKGKSESRTFHSICSNTFHHHDPSRSSKSRIAYTHTHTNSHTHALNTHTRSHTHTHTYNQTCTPTILRRNPSAPTCKHMLYQRTVATFSSILRTQHRCFRSHTHMLVQGKYTCTTTIFHHEILFCWRLDPFEEHRSRTEREGGNKA